jgi:hypothetical protein
MALGQQYAVGGRKVRPNYTDVINTQTQYLPALYKQKSEDEYNTAMMGLREKELGLKEQELATYEQLEREALEQQKKQARQANLLAGGNLALKTGLGLYGDKLAKGGGTVGTPQAGGTFGGAGTMEGASVALGGYSQAGGASSNISPASWTGKATDWGKWGGALTGYESWAGGAAGGLAANLFGTDEGRTKKALIGGGGGAAVSALASGGDIYKSIVGGVLGGLGGLF